MARSGTFDSSITSPTRKSPEIQTSVPLLIFPGSGRET